MEQFIVFRGQKNNVEDVWCKCKWCGKEYGHNVTRLTQHFTSKFAPRQRGNMELPAFRREGSNRHIKGCECASQQLKFEIRALNNRERQRAAELASLHRHGIHVACPRRGGARDRISIPWQHTG
ncbi:hypothetical protein R1flu_021633 [Riccia fluitans]|uniref:BED-type domain-containing protein n=1 Tax=Riccia fluitans TaxID=41844 RepID=A0ABD1ZPY7_9MARC